MAKGKNLNPADAYRKAQRKKELKKNKSERAKARDFALVKRDTRDLEDEIEKLETGTELSAPDKSRLAGLKIELAKIMEKKEEYVKEHPEQRRLVYRSRRQDNTEDRKEAPPEQQKRNLFNKHGLPRHPERSIYYDPVMNPYGVPPPGMPYIEKPSEQAEDSGEDIEDSDKDIVMPDGPPPGTSTGDSEGDGDDDIPMPEGPPPSNVSLLQNVIKHVSGTDQHSWVPSSAVPTSVPLPLPHAPMSMPPPGLNPGVIPLPPPPPPPGFYPRRIQSASAIQDPLSSIPHQTYQAHRATQLPPAHPSLPPKPPTTAAFPSSALHAHAVIAAEPELRDLKKEATAFVPASLKRKRLPGASGPSKVNAAPSVGGQEGPAPQARPDLVGVLKSQLGTITPPPPNNQAQGKGQRPPPVKERDDYQKFVDEVSDLLGS